MAGRDLLVRIRADVTDFQNKMRLAQGQVAGFDKNLQTNASKSGRVLSALGLSYAGVGIAAGAAVSSMVKSAANFEQGLANVNATGAVTEAQLTRLREQALQFGRTTTYSATEATSGMEALLKAGVSASDVIGGGLKGALDLAAAGEMEVSAASEAAASAMTQFGLSGKDVPHIADLMAAGAGKAQGEVSDMAAALNQAGLVASGFGYSLEETAGVLAEFASAGLVGSDAGTSLRTMLIRAAAPTDTARAVMKQYGIETRNANGELKNASQLAGQLQRAFRGKSDAERDAALVTIFGQDAIRGANVLYKDGAEGAKEWTEAVNDQGFAADTAAKRTDTLRGDIDRLKNSWDAFGSGAGGGQGLRPIIQTLDQFVDSLAKADKAITDMQKRNAAGKGSFWDNVFGDTLSGDGIDPIDLFLKGPWKAGKLSRPQDGLDIPLKVRFKLAYANTTKEMARIADEAGLKSREVRIALKLTGTPPKQISAVVNELERASRIKMLKELYPTYNPKQIQALLKDLEKVEQATGNPLIIKPEVEGPTGKLQGLLDDFSKSPKPPKLSVKDLATPTLRKIQNDIARVKSKEVTITTRYRTTGTPPGPWMGGKVGAWAGQMGFNSGGIVPGTPPSDPRMDNVLARDQSGRALAVRSGEWIINERASRLNDRLLHAINSGADFSGFASGGRVGGSSSSSPAGPLRISGELTLSADGRAFIEGVALEQAANLSAAESRMSRAAASRRRA